MKHSARKPTPPQFGRLYGVKILRYFLWAAVAAAAGICLGGIALRRGEHINSLWLVLAAACSYATAYRFYGKFIAARVMTLNDRRSGGAASQPYALRKV